MIATFSLILHYLLPLLGPRQSFVSFTLFRRQTLPNKRHSVPLISTVGIIATVLLLIAISQHYSRQSNGTHHYRWSRRCKNPESTQKRNNSFPSLARLRDVWIKGLPITRSEAFGPSVRIVFQCEPWCCFVVVWKGWWIATFLSLVQATSTSSCPNAQRTTFFLWKPLITLSAVRVKN